MNCMKCDSTKGLSIKKYTRTGEARYMCRACRRTSYHQLRRTKSDYMRQLEKEELRRIKWMVEWDMMARRINGQIMRKYA